MFFQQRAQSNLTAKGALLFIILFLLCPVAIYAQNSNPVTVDTETASPNPSPTPEEKRSTVRGKVVYEDTGRPVRRARIFLFGATGKGGPEMSGQTDSNGDFEIRNVPQGKYYAMVNSPGIVTPLGLVDDPKMFDREPDKAFFEGAKNFLEEYSIDGKSDVKIEVKAKRGGAINGRVTYENGDPAVSVKVSILRKSGKNLTRVITGLNEAMFSGVSTDDRGIYRIAGLPEGEYLISVAEPVSHSGSSMPRGEMGGFFEAMFGAAGSLLVTYYPNVNSSEEASAIKLTLGQEQSDINITLADRALYKISGRVVMRGDKSPVKNVTVRLKKNDNKVKAIISEMEINENRTDDNGSWTFQELPEGTYTVIVDSYSETETKYDDKGEYIGSETKRQLAGKKQEVKLLDGDVSDIVIELSDGGSIEGKVVSASGKPLLASVYMRAETTLNNSSDDDSEVYERRNESGYVEGDGKFTIRSLPAGPVKLTANLSGEQSDKYYVKSMTLNGQDLMSSAINMTEGGKVKNVQVVLGDDGATLKGKVVSADNKPASGVSVALIPANPSQWQRQSNNNNFRMTDPQGEFSITTAPGEYYVVFLRAGESIQNMSADWIRERTANAQRVLLNPNDNKAVTFNAPQ